MRSLLACFVFASGAILRADSSAEALPDLRAAIALFDAKKFPDARAALEKIVASDPKNAAATYYLGRSIEPRGDANALPEALKWYEKAVELAPENEIYLARFGGASLELAGRTMSVSSATRGRDAMEKAVKLNPDDLDAREGLMQFYDRAPWPIGSSAKAAAQLEEIRKRDPDRATVLSVMTKANAKEYDAAFKLCTEVLSRKPDNYTALYYYGRTAAISGQNLERGLECLQKCLTLPQPGPASPTYSHVWNRIGNIDQKLNRPADARTAYENAVKIDSTNKAAADALAKLK